MIYNNGSARSSRKLVACALVVIGLLGGLVLIGCGSSGNGGSNGTPTTTPLEFSYELLGDDLTVNVMVPSGTTIDADIMVAITLTPEGGEALTGTVTVDQATGSGTITFMGASSGNYELMASSSASIRVVSDTDFELLQTLQLSTADTDNSVTGSGDASFSLPLVMPARDAYKISLVDTGTPADSAANLVLAISDPDGADQGSSGSRRLYRDAAGTKTLGATVPTTPNDFTNGLIYAFLPGDDGADAPEIDPNDPEKPYYELIWRRNDNTTAVAYPSQLDAATEYTVTITATPDTVNWRLRVELHDLPRLPANIATTFRSMLDGQIRIPNDPDEGFYLVYNPTVGESRISLQLERVAFGNLAGTDFVSGTGTLRLFTGNQNECTMRMDPQVPLAATAVNSMLAMPTELIASIDQPIYCLQLLTSGALSNAPIAEVIQTPASYRSRDSVPEAFKRRTGHFVFTLLSEPVSTE